MSLRPLLLAGLLIAASLAITPTSANPVIPYCPGVTPGGATPETADTIDPTACLQTTGRIFPEAAPLAEYFQADAGGHVNTATATDYVNFFEFQAGLEYLNETYPDFIEVHEVGQSVGWERLDGGHDTFPVYMVEITNEQSPMPLEERQALLFMLSIHGVEKGGREGGFRIMEDLVRNIGFAASVVEDGAGLPETLIGPRGEPVETYHDYLEFQRVFLLFPNPDGWVHEELVYMHNQPCTGGLIPNAIQYCRTNGNFVDLNRQAPTTGWQNPNRNVVGEPESIAYYNWMQDSGIDWAYAIDVHGMLNHENFAAIMLPAGSMSPQEMQRSLRLSETLKERLNGNDHFAVWETLLGSAEAGGELVAGPSQEFGACVEEPFLTGFSNCNNAAHALGSGTFAEYYTVWDAIGYTDSGFNGDYFAQNTGLNAPGYDIELAYNHITFDAQYEVGALFNDYHVETMREIVKSFMDGAALDVQISFETGGLRTMYLESPFIATNLDDENPEVGGWAAENEGDDLWDYGTDTPFVARPAKYWEDMQPFVRSGDTPGVLVRGTATDMTAARLGNFDTLAIPGSAVTTIENDPGRLQAVRDWVEAGGTLVLTDEALRFLDLADITADAVDVSYRYAGGLDFDLDHWLLDKVRGGVRQTYEPTPLGFAVGANAAPVWWVDQAAVESLGGTVAGYEYGTGPQPATLFETLLGAEGSLGLGHVSLGEMPLGDGTIRFLGALLPDPTEEFYHPYGLDDYATTYSGNQILRNMLGWTEVFEAPPIVITEDGRIIEAENEPTRDEEAAANADPDDNDSPSFGLAVLVVALAALAVMRRRSG